MTLSIPVRPREAELHAVATRLFRQRGFHATSMRDLGDALGMNRGSLYHYITAKDELLWAILTRALDLLEARVLPILEGDAPAVDRLTNGIREHLRVRLAAADVVPIQSAVERDRLRERFHARVGAAREPPAPRLLTHSPFSTRD